MSDRLKSKSSTNGLDAEVKHSTETVLLRVVSHLPLATDQNQGAILVLLDLSAAFDTVHCDIVVGRLASRLGIRGVQCLYLLESYFEYSKGQY